MKTREKISGCFRTPEWPNRFAAIRSVIVSAKKKGESIYRVLQNLFSDPPEAERLPFGT